MRYGLAMTSSTPRARASFGSIPAPQPVTSTKRVVGQFLRTSAATSHPFLPAPSPRSEMTSSNDSSRKRCSAASPEVATTTWCPRWVSTREAIFANCSSSSTTSTRIDRAAPPLAFSPAASSTIASGAATIGKVNLKVLPRPGVESTSSRPACRSIIATTCGRPRPVPRSPLVVKNGSKMRACSSCVMPVPVSRTSTTASSSLRRTCRKIEPPLGSASTALKIKLVNASRNAPTRRGESSDVAQQLGQVDPFGFGHQLLCARERQQPLQCLTTLQGSTRGDLDHLAHAADVGDVEEQFLAGHVAVTGDQRQRLVQVVCDATGHLTQRAQPFGVRQRLARGLGLLALADIHRDAGHLDRATLDIAVDAALGEHPAYLAAIAHHPRLALGL